jgi:arylsulfatase B
MFRLLFSHLQVVVLCRLRNLLLVVFRFSWCCTLYYFCCGVFCFTWAQGKQDCVCLLSGRTWDGQWDDWYGPSGRDPAYSYNLTLVYNSAAGRALSNTSAALPLNPEEALRLRAAAGVSCGSTTNSSCAGTDSVCLFNLMRDPCELDNLSHKYPLRVASLQRLLDGYNATVVPPLNKEADPRSNPKYWNYTWTNWMDHI